MKQSIHETNHAIGRPVNIIPVPKYIVSFVDSESPEAKFTNVLLRKVAPVRTKGDQVPSVDGTMEVQHLGRLVVMGGTVFERKKQKKLSTPSVPPYNYFWVIANGPAELPRAPKAVPGSTKMTPKALRI